MKCNILNVVKRRVFNFFGDKYIPELLDFSDFSPCIEYEVVMAVKWFKGLWVMEVVAGDSMEGRDGVVRDLVVVEADVVFGVSAVTEA